MINSYADEVWKDVVFDEKISEKMKYKISNYGRVINCCGKEEKLMKGSMCNKYLAIALLQKKGKFTNRYLHRLVAQEFLEKKEHDEYVIHLNYKNEDNHVENLKWVDHGEKEAHRLKGPSFTKNGGRRRTYSKLTEGRVRMIKKKLNDPNRKTRMKMIAKQFGISEMQLYRIKTGENWGYITVDD